MKSKRKNVTMRDIENIRKRVDNIQIKVDLATELATFHENILVYALPETRPSSMKIIARTRKLAVNYNKNLTELCNSLNDMEYTLSARKLFK